MSDANTFNDLEQLDAYLDFIEKNLQGMLRAVGQAKATLVKHSKELDGLQGAIEANIQKTALAAIPIAPGTPTPLPSHQDLPMASDPEHPFMQAQPLEPLSGPTEIAQEVPVFTADTSASQQTRVLAEVTARLKAAGLADIAGGLTKTIQDRMKADLRATNPNYLNNFYGPKNLFTQFFSGRVMDTGRGPLAPAGAGQEGLKQYGEDAKKTPYLTLQNWPTGFYQNSDTGDIQFMISKNGFADRTILILDGLPSVNPTITFISDDGKISDAKDLPYDILNRYKDQIEEILKRLI